MKLDPLVSESGICEFGESGPDGLFSFSEEFLLSLDLKLCDGPGWSARCIGREFAVVNTDLAPIPGKTVGYLFRIVKADPQRSIVFCEFQENITDYRTEN